MTATSAGSSSCLTARGLDISLAALQRQDPYINDIVDVASQVALYTYNNRANEWTGISQARFHHHEQTQHGEPDGANHQRLGLPAQAPLPALPQCTIGYPWHLVLR
ncbi:mRNA-decapping enzyme 1B [Liparis tanakae]|uniref:5'-(N(7)-methylguanosine 5'-triphospho)-[mRNA] hydrolase n=1 Tax=Liparis tanakae TaxID=230148 RepID=A0A4Z2HI03_9TELE|nr:mRNA-decapping enzyme 1B [Liparis tanakae]